MSKKIKPALIRISTEIVGMERGAQGGCPGIWYVRKFLVQQTYPVNIGEEPLWEEVSTPDEARAVAQRFASLIGGRIYRGHLPEKWHSALADFPRC